MRRLLALGMLSIAIAASPVSAQSIEDLVAASRILADQGVLDAFGHVSMRHPKDANRYLLSRNLAPALVTAEDILEYDLDSNALNAAGRASFLERFIHGAIYKLRPDVNAVVHSHSPAVIPFGITQVPMKPTFHMAGFLVAGVPVFEIRNAGGPPSMLVTNNSLAKSLADTLGDKPVVLMRGHGNVVVGPSVQLAVYRAVYTEVNARLQTIAMSLGGPVTYLNKEEGENMENAIAQQVRRPWDLWKQRVMPPK